jgi:mono/diheme cytochrome c family protein
MAAQDESQHAQPETHADMPGMSHASHAHHVHTHHPDVKLPEGDADRGKQLFQDQNCSKCHPTVAKKKGFGPDLYGIFDPQIHGHRMSQGDVVYQIRHGGGKMPPYGKRINDQQMADIVAYLKSLRPSSPQQ